MRFEGFRDSILNTEISAINIKPIFFSINYKSIQTMKNSVFKSIIMVAALACCMSCEKDSDTRDAYLGSFRIKEQAIVEGVVVEDNYNISIVKSSVNDMDIIISNILNTGETVNATVSGTNFTIPQQTLGQGGVSGSGRIEGASYIRFSVLYTAQLAGQINFSCEGPKQ
jgi:hypothetical protein